MILKMRLNTFRHFKELILPSSYTNGKGGANWGKTDNDKLSDDGYAHSVKLIIDAFIPFNLLLEHVKDVKSVYPTSKEKRNRRL